MIKVIKKEMCHINEKGDNMIKLGVIYGGISTEHDVSIMSAKSVIENLDKEKYDIHEIYINKYGKWMENDEEIYNLIWNEKTQI